MKKYLLPLILILFLTFTLIGDCWVAGYDQRIKLTIDNTKIDATLTDFPVTAFFTVTQAEEIFAEFDADEDFDRGQFALGDDTLLKAEKELFDDSESLAIYHIKIPTVSSSADTDYYFYYDNDAGHNTTYIGAINTVAGAAVWNVDFDAVYHMVDETDSTVADSTSNDNDITKRSSDNPLQATGHIGQGQDFSSDYMTHPTFWDTMPTDLTVEMCIKADTIPQTILFYKHNIDGDDRIALQLVVTTDKIRFWGQSAGGSILDALTTNTVNAGTWYYITGVHTSGSALKVYLNDTEDTGGTLGTVGNGTFADAFIGASTTTPSNPFDGTMDEVRFSSTPRTAAWLKGTYNSLFDTLLTYGSEEERPPWLAGWDYRIELSIADYAGDIGASVTWFPATVFLNSTQGEEVFAELTTSAEYLKVAFTKEDGTTELYAEKELFTHDSDPTSQYPFEQTDTYVKATSKRTTSFRPRYATDPALSLIGNWSGNSWASQIGVNIAQRFHIDLGSAKVIRRIYYENGHDDGGSTDIGVQNFTFWGSNTGAGTFDDLVYANDEGWTELTVAQNTFDQHIASDVADPKYITVTNATAYRYYAFKFADNHGDVNLMGVRRIELQTSDPFAIYHISRDGWVINANTSVYMYYDAGHADNNTYIGVIGARTEVWDGNFKAVYHMVDDTTSTILDSTSNNNDGTKGTANEPPEVTGKVGQGQDFDGSDDIINANDSASLDLTTALTLEVWAKPDDWNNNATFTMLAKALVGASQSNYQLSKNNTNILTFSYYNGGWIDINDDSAVSYTNGVWYHLVASVDEGVDEVKFYRNGSLLSTQEITVALIENNQKLGIGWQGFAAQAFDGVEDEVRISGNIRNLAWAKGTFNSGSDTLFTYGSEETAPVVGITWNGITITKWNGVEITIPINTQ